MGTGAAFDQGTGAAFIQGTGASRGAATVEYGDGLWCTSTFPAPATYTYDIYKTNYPTDNTVIASFSPAYDCLGPITHDDTDFYTVENAGNPETVRKHSGQITSTVLDSLASSTYIRYGFSYEDSGYVSGARGVATFYLLDGLSNTVITSQSMASVSPAGENPGDCCFTASDLIWSNLTGGNDFEIHTSGHFTSTVVASIQYETHTGSPIGTIYGITTDGADTVIDYPSGYFYTKDGLCNSQTINSSLSWIGSLNPYMIDWGSYATRYV